MRIPYIPRDKAIKQADSTWRKPNPLYAKNYPEMSWAMSLMDPFNIHGVKQPTLFPVQSTVTRMHGLIQVTSNASGWAWFFMNPSSSTVLSYNAGDDTNIVPGVMTSSVARCINVEGHPLYRADWRVVNAGFRAFLTTPYINSTGMFLGA